MVRIFLDAINGEHDYKLYWMLHTNIQCDHCGYNASMGYFCYSCPSCGRPAEIPTFQIGPYTMIASNVEEATKLKDEFEAIRVAAAFIDYSVGYSYFAKQVVVYFNNKEIGKRSGGGILNLVFKMNEYAQVERTITRSSYSSIADSSSENNNLFSPIEYLKTLL